MNDMPECYTEATRKARKNHHCTSCCAEIKKGDFYYHLKGIWDGEAKDYKMCGNCETVIKDFKKMDANLGYDEGPPLGCGGVGEWLHGFMCTSWHGEEAAKDIAELFCIPLDYVKRVCGIK